MISVDKSKALAPKKTVIPSMDLPLFAQYAPDIKKIKVLARKFSKKKNIVVIGNGGSITSFSYYAQALGTKKKWYIISTMEPDALEDVRKKCIKKDTVIIAVSKSGTTVGVIEALMYFIDYQDVIVITENKKSTLKIIQERSGFLFMEHPPVGGRYSGFTPSGLLPAAIAGIDIEGIWNGAHKAYSKYSPKRKQNDAFDLAHVLYVLDKKGFTEIFIPIYSSRLMGSAGIITQLIHESVGKNKKGQTVLTAFAPESQHHTNQRYFGGRKNMLGCFVVVDEFDKKYQTVKIPKKLQDIPLRSETIADLHDNFYSKALHAEFIGTREDSIQKKIPHVVIHVGKITPESVGAFLAFWHYVTVYLCVLTDVNPFDQPQVESSKEISFQLRLKK
ncbi:MAG: hypothetical protein ACMXYE_03050 [Candidatus Woesearchaeota archaeon]